MYVPPSFDVADRRWALRLAAAYPFGVLATGESDFPQISHLPMLAEERDGEMFVLGHVARANPHAESISRGAPATAAFTGAHAYVSASWYERPYETVPTWNYGAFLVCGTLRECNAREVVARLTHAMEDERTNPWCFEKLDEKYAANQLRGIVAFEMRAERFYIKAKYSQNRTQADRNRVIAALAASENPGDRDCAEGMAEFAR